MQEHYNQAVGLPMSNGLLGVSQNRFIPLMLKAIQELSEKNEALEKRIEELEK